MLHPRVGSVSQWAGIVREQIFKSTNCVLIGCLCSYFNENQYPDEAKREEIANACNAVIQKPGKAASCALRGSSRLQVLA